MISKKVLEELGFERVIVDENEDLYYYSLNIGDINFHSNVGERNFTVSMLHSSTMEMIDEADLIVLIGILRRSIK
jgi:hypothetical protein